MSGKLTKQFKERIITKFKKFINHHEREYDWIKYLAVDKSGLIFGYEKKPIKRINNWASPEHYICINDCSIEFDSTRWTNTLIKIDWEEILKEILEDDRGMNWTRDPTIARVEELVSPSGGLKFIVAPDIIEPETYVLHMSYKNDWVEKRVIRKFNTRDIEEVKAFTEDWIKEIKTMK